MVACTSQNRFAFVLWTGPRCGARINLLNRTRRNGRKRKTNNGKSNLNTQTSTYYTPIHKKRDPDHTGASLCRFSINGFTMSITSYCAAQRFDIYTRIYQPAKRVGLSKQKRKPVFFFGCVCVCMLVRNGKWTFSTFSVNSNVCDDFCIGLFTGKFNQTNANTFVC